MPKKVTEHFLVPKHELVPKERINEVIERFGVEFEKLPGILKDDPVVEEIGAKRGDMIKITRTSPTAGRAIYFRVIR